MNSTFKKRFFHAAGCRLLILIGLVISQPMWAQTADSSASFSIKDCIEYATKKNSKLKVSRYDEEIAQQQVRQIRGRGLPQVNVNGTFEDRIKIPLFIIPGLAEGGIKAGYQFNTNLSGEVTQMLFDPSFWVGLKAAKYSNQLYQQNTQQVNEQTAYSIADAYYQVIVAQKQLQLLHSNLTNTQATLNSTELQFKNGVAKQVDVSRLKVNASNLQSQIRQSELSLLQSLNNLKFQMGMPLTEQITLSDTTLTFNESDAFYSDASENSFEGRIDYRILQTNLALQGLDKRNIASGYYPTLTAFANYGYTGQGSNFGFFKTPGNGWIDYTSSSIGLRLRIPIFDGLQRSAQVQQSKLKARQIEENITLTKQNISLEVANSLTQYRNTVQRIESEQKNVELAQEVYQITQLEFREGVGTSTDVVNAETSLRQAQNTYITTLLDLYRARLNIERSKGNLLPYLNSAK
ncbi:TolC family protein [Xanthocytophaga flava]|uniref:TolC family protein n=1 Tax=Xanthocytophaga flava TaxID=3048013 RepID=UPI0028D0B1FD|nr:TolC family protein [Xanthocytophaga flavus]MDJ1471779.1 TolC family protein [Xanthocytophaga flavus]